MDEIFFIQSGKARITVDKEEIPTEPGMVVRVPKMTSHVWKSHGEPSRMLVTFVPRARQTMYLKELGELVRSGDSWREGIRALQKKYDNIPLQMPLPCPKRTLSTF